MKTENKINIEKINYYGLGQVYKPNTKLERFESAIFVLKHYYDDFMQMNHTIGYRVKNKTTDNYIKFMNQCKIDKIIDISLTGSDFTIYDSIHYNTIARYSHDLIHHNYNLDFSPKDEILVTQIQLKNIKTWMDRRGVNGQTYNDILEIIYHDITSQVLYYDKYKNFLINQKKFVYDLFLNGHDITKEKFSDFCYLNGIVTGCSGVYLNGVLIQGDHDKRDTNINIIKFKRGL